MLKIKSVAAPLPALKYTNIAILLHWLIAGLITFNVILALSAGSVGPDWERPFINLHKSIGLTVLGLVLIRIGWRFWHHPPQLPATMARYEKTAAHITHALLYFVMISLPLSGWIHDSAWSAAATHPLKLFGFIPWFRLSFVSGLPPEVKEQMHTSFGAIHSWLGYLLYILVFVHIMGALKHIFIDKENILSRMKF